MLHVTDHRLLSRLAELQILLLASLFLSLEVTATLLRKFIIRGFQEIIVITTIILA